VSRPALGGTPRTRRAFRPEVLVQAGRPPLPPAQASRLIRDLAARLSVPFATVSVVFGDDAMLRNLNHRFRGKDRPTDVLSFPAGEDGHLGDIVISSETTRRQARRRGHDAASEARILLIHGFLHLLGYDHTEDDGEMDALERTMRWELLRR